MTSVVIVDDEAMVRDGLRLILELGGVTVVGEARDGDEAFTVVTDRRPDVVLMDLRMPGTDGIQATRRIVQAGLPTRVLALTRSTWTATSTRRCEPVPPGSCSRTRRGSVSLRR
jgi:YesN/AraC family two-component response regulator